MRDAEAARLKVVEAMLAYQKHIVERQNSPVNSHVNKESETT